MNDKTLLQQNIILTAMHTSLPQRLRPQHRSPKIRHSSLFNSIKVNRYHPIQQGNLSIQ